MRRLARSHPLDLAPNSQPFAVMDISRYTLHGAVHMSKIEAIEKQIQKLSEDDLARFRQWFADFDAEVWDRQLERDVAAGKLDSLAKKALEEHSKSKTTKL